MMRARRAAAGQAAAGQSEGGDMQSSGAPLPGATREEFETSVGRDLGAVRVHDGPASAERADELGAAAFTEGQDIHFAAGQFQPATPAGETLLAHEVAHTVQNAGTTEAPRAKARVSTPGDAIEQAADEASAAMVAGRAAEIASGSGQGGIQRMPTGAARQLAQANLDAENREYVQMLLGRAGRDPRKVAEVVTVTAPFRNEAALKVIADSPEYGPFFASAVKGEIDQKRAAWGERLERAKANKGFPELPDPNPESAKALLKRLFAPNVDFEVTPEMRKLAGAVMGAVNAEGRPLSSAEEQRVREVFADAVDYTRVRIVKGGLISAGNTARTLGNKIHLPESDFADDGNGQSSNVLMDDGMNTLVHEMAHVWQYQHEGLQYIPDALIAQLHATIEHGDRNVAYEWEPLAVSGAPLSAMNPEQQAHCFEQYNRSLRRIRAAAFAPEDTRIVARATRYVQEMLARGAPKPALRPLPGGNEP